MVSYAWRGGSHGDEKLSLCCMAKPPRLGKQEPVTFVCVGKVVLCSDAGFTRIIYYLKKQFPLPSLWLLHTATAATLTTSRLLNRLFVIHPYILYIYKSHAGLHRALVGAGGHRVGYVVSLLLFLPFRPGLPDQLS